MDGVEPRSVYILSAVFYLLPIGCLIMAWVSAIRSEMRSDLPAWRTKCLVGGLILATVTTLAALSFGFSRLQCGGRMHGMAPSPGFWQSIRPVFFYGFIATVLFTALGRGQGRSKLFGWVLGMILVNLAVGLIAMD
jgi:hypothetical protein